MFQDLRQSIRAITRAKGTAAVLLLSLALGTGVNAAVYGVLDALLLRGPAGVEDSSRLVSVYTSELSGTSYGASSYPDFLSIKSSTKFLAASAAIDDNTVENVLVGESGQSARIAAVSDDYFVVLQMRPHAGRLLAPADAAADPASVVVSHRLSEQLGGADEILEKTLTIADREYVVVGVAPPRFRGLQIGRECDAWILMGKPPASRGNRRLAIVARLAPDATLDKVNEDLRRLSGRLASRFPETNRGSLGQADAPRRIIAVPYSTLDPAAKRHTFLIGLIVGGASTLLLASACLNVGSLLLSKTVTRRHEIAIKMTLGATRSRLVRQLLTESCCLSTAGAGVGLLFAMWTMGAIPALFIAEHAERLDTRLDARVMLLTVGVAFLAGALFGLAPALQTTASPPVTALRADSGSVSGPQNGARLRALVVGAQVTLSTVLLLATGLLVKSLTQALEGDAGSTVRNVAFVSMALSGRFVDPFRSVRHRDALIDRLEDLDDVEAVGWTATLPLGKGNRRRFRINGNSTDVSDTVELETSIVSPGYFHVLGLSRIEGRLFDERDGALAPPVVVVDELLARRYFGPNAAGRYVVDARGTRAEIIGVVRSGRYRTLQQPPQPHVYYPATQEYLSTVSTVESGLAWRGHLLVRTAGDPEARLPTILSAIGATGEGGTILRASTLETHLSESRALDRLTTTLVGLCGLIALAMATIGVYGIMTDAVQRRTREIGLRVALGAPRAHVARLVFTQAVYLALAGLLTGSVVAVGMTHVARSAIGTTASLDIVTLATASGALATVIAVAAILPLRRALRVSPNIALRAE